MVIAGCSLWLTGVAQVPQDQLEPVLRVAGQLRIRGLDSDYSRESSMEPERWGRGGCGNCQWGLW